METINIIEHNQVRGITVELRKIVKTYLREDNLDEFIYRLYELENIVRDNFPISEDLLDYYNGEDLRGLWFKFFHDDTGATTIRNLEIDLNNTNKKYFRECLELNSIIPFFS